MKLKKRQIIATLFLAILLCAAFAIFIPKIIAATNPDGLLQVSGQWIVDANGNRIQLRGAGSDYTAYNEPSSITQYISWLQSTGCDVVRLGFIFPNTGGWSNKDNTGSSVYSTATMKSIVSQFWAAGIYSILARWRRLGNSGRSRRKQPYSNV